MNELLKKLKENSIHVAVYEGQLKVSYDGELDESLLMELRENKEELITYLSGKESYQTEFESIPRVADSKTYPTSSGQRRIWVMCQLEEVNVAYNEHKLEIIQGDLDVDFLEKVCNIMIARYEIFRTGFVEDENGEPVQHVADIASIDFKVDVVDHQQLAGNDPKAYLKNYLFTPFDLSTGPLFRVLAIEVEKGQWALCFVIHHIICDGWSFELMIKEFRELFMAGEKASGEILPPLSIQYRDYAVWQRAQLESDEMEVHRKFWLDRFSDDTSVLELPTDFTRPAFKTFNGQRIRTWINPELSEGIKKLSQETGSTLYMGLLATVNALFYRYTGQTDLTFGSPIAGREHPDLGNQLGFFLNTLALRTEFSGDNTFNDLLGNVRNSAFNAFEHQDYPFDELVAESGKKFDKSRNPLFDVAVALLNTKVGDNHAEVQESVPSSEAEMEDQNGGIDVTISKFDLTFNFIEKNGGIYLGLEYNTDLFLESTVKRLLNHYLVLLESIVASPESPLNQLDCISQEEKKKLLELSGTPYTSDSETVLKRFESAVAKYTDNKAVCFNDRSLTYGELDELSNQLAAYLRSEHQLSKGEFAAILLPRSEWQVVAELGIMKTGVIFIPLDPTHPEDRIKHIVESSNAKLILDEKMIQSFREKKDTITVDTNDFPEIDGSDEIYVIYTSGSTGKPKGVLVEHHSVVNMLDGYGLEEELVSSLTANYTFDASILEIYSAILSGGTLHIPELETILTMDLYVNFLCDNKIQQTFMHAMLLEETAEALDVMGDRVALRRFWTGVQKINFEEVRWYFDKGIHIVNAYGPTETTVCATFFDVTTEMKSDKQLPIGKPIKNTAIYILDGDGQLSGMGMVGELCIAGRGVSRGYLNKPEMTDERFVDNPFGDGKMYRTGDYARWLADGNIEFIGRRDDQVKVSGYRIEIGEVESALDSIDFVLQRAVLAKKDSNGETILIGYVVVEQGSTEEQLLEALRAIIPEYMIPARFMNVLELPMNANGKVDKKALPEPEDLDIIKVVDYVEPRNEIEEQLVDIWKNLLGVEKIGVKDDFFHLGGNSLKVIRLISQINKHFGLKYDLKGVYSESTIEAIAEKIRVDQWFKNDTDSEKDTENQGDYTEIKI